MWMRKRTLFLSSSLFLIACLATSAAQAVPMMLIDVPGGDPAQDLFGDGTCSGDPNCEGAGVQFWQLDGAPVDLIEGGNPFGRVMSWTASLQDGTDGSDPFVFTGITIHNNTTANQQYVVEVVLPLAVATPYNNNSGSLVLSLTDSNGAATDRDTNGDGSGAPIYAFVDQFDGFVYRGNVDGSAELERNFAPIPVNVLVEGQSTNQTQNFPPPIGAGPGVANEISLRLAFELSAGDSAEISSFYTITPEPGTGVLMGLGMVGLAISRRRRS